MNTSPEEESPKANFASLFRAFVKETFTLDNVNYDQSTEDIKSGITFKGFNIWILICSILICSLGLNMDSTAVVIGAMLISPLMGPIVGLGLGIGIFDRKLIFKALKNLGVATFISILTAYLFFKITPTEETHELLARTKPTLLDLFVAFFGGIAGILASSRSLSTNVIPGVAIATALMPPLCTAGYGLAIKNWDYFFGGFYLFTMNCIMISLAALIVVLYLRYPKYSFVNETQKKNVRAGITIIVLLVSIPSIFFYYNLLQENLHKGRIDSYIEKEIIDIPGIYLNSYSMKEKDNQTFLNVNVSGLYIEPDSVAKLQERMSNYNIDAKLKIIQPEPIGFKEQRLASLKSDIIRELYDNSTNSMKTKDDEIVVLKNEVQKLGRSEKVSIAISNLAKTQYDINKMAVHILIYNDGEKMDTIPTAVVQWKKAISRNEKAKQTEKLRELLKIQMDTEKFEIIELAN